MPAADVPRSVLLGLTGLRIEGGIATVSRCIARALEQCHEAGRVDRIDRVLLLEDPQQAATPPRSGTQWLARGSRRRFAWQLWRAFRRHRHELVLFDHLGLARAASLPLPPFPPPRTAIFVHGAEMQSARAGVRARVLGRASLLLTNSEFTADVLRRQIPARADRIRTTPLCVDPERVEAWEKSLSSHPDPPRERAALIVGRMWQEERGKGHDELIAAWPAVRTRVPGAELWIVGTGDDRPRLEERARSLGMADAVRFLGRVTDAELSQLYRRASLFAMPSRQEGFGLVYAEAMWHGLPCIGSTADAAGQVIVDGETGLLVPYGDVHAIGSAVAALLSDPDRARALGEAGCRRAHERFAYARFERDLLAALSIA
jgi:phosphatidylinositol alpha-1,6-mannosyltransferase